MSKDKQIEEMAKAIFANCDCGLFEDEAYIIAEFVIEEQGYRKASEIEELEARLADVTSNWQKIHDSYTADCIEHYNKGRSDVAREIFEEIEQEIKNHGICYAQRKIVELKKKYTEVGE